MDKLEAALTEGAMRTNTYRVLWALVQAQQSLEPHAWCEGCRAYAVVPHTCAAEARAPEEGK